MQRLLKTIHRRSIKESQNKTHRIKNAIKRRDTNSLPAEHTHGNNHTFDWTKTKVVGRAQTQHAREFEEAWYSKDNDTINRHVYIHLIFTTKEKRQKNYKQHQDYNNPI